LTVQEDDIHEGLNFTNIGLLLKKTLNGLPK